MRLFINHCHVAPAGTFSKDNPKKGALELLKAMMDSHGIEKAVAFAPFLHCMPADVEYRIFCKTEWECNEWLYRELKKFQGIFGFVTVNPKNPACAAILTEFVGKGFVGVKMHPPVFQARVDDPAFDAYYFTIERLGVPILFHMGSHGWQPEEYRPSRLGNVARRHPQLRIIIEHMGGTEGFREALEVLVKNENCYAGITSTLNQTIEGGRPNASYLTPEMFRELLQSVSSQRIIYGTDYPFNFPEDIVNEIKTIQSMAIGDEDKRNILGGTLETLCLGT
ncbi:MAG: amidohydrolase family protein [Verrucomicrobiae bacterium]|nr:amidohydrolase family protein [Verrucomicrobiae bacterium]